MIDKYNQVIDATIIQTSWKRVFYGLVEMNELKLTAYDKNNRIVTEIPYRERTAVPSEALAQLPQPRICTNRRDQSTCRMTI